MLASRERSSLRGTHSPNALQWRWRRSMLVHLQPRARGGRARRLAGAREQTLNGRLFAAARRACHGLCAANQRERRALDESHRAVAAGHWGGPHASTARRAVLITLLARLRHALAGARSNRAVGAARARGAASAPSMTAMMERAACRGRRRGYASSQIPS
ncbi:hypothetical protein FGB62_22g475 [Gracilaria domingensis]|nr:hypothetical protein FGB62_22g475 [Gracilaria domingensis]